MKLPSSPTFLLSALVCFSLGTSSALHAKDESEGVELRSKMGWTNSVHLSTIENTVRTVVAPDVGGRVVEYSLHTENILFENAEVFGKTLAQDPSGSFSFGGYQCDIGPELAGVPDHKMLWMGEWKRTETKDYFVKVQSPVDPVLHMSLQKDFILDPDSGELGIIQRMQNLNSTNVNYCLWDRTQAKGGGFVLFPLNKKSKHKAGWSLRRKGEKDQWIYDGKTPSSPNVKIMDGVLVMKAEGPAGKIGADSDAGYIAYARGQLLFVKYFPYFQDGNYSDGGNSVEAYWNDDFAELEPLSPEIALKPNGSYEFPEKWLLIRLQKDVNTFEDARALLKRIPASPFRKKK